MAAPSDEQCVHFFMWHHSLEHRQRHFSWTRGRICIFDCSRQVVYIINRKYTITRSFPTLKLKLKHSNQALSRMSCSVCNNNNSIEMEDESTKQTFAR